MGGIILNYLNGPNIITRSLKGEERGRNGKTEGDGTEEGMSERWDVRTLWL